MPEPLPCDREEDEEKAELRVLIDRWEKLFERCMTGPLPNAEQKELDDLYAALLLCEEERWVEFHDVDPMVIEHHRDKLGLDFPLLYFQLGLIPGQFDD